MSLNASLRLLMDEYPAAKLRTFKDDSVADFIRHEIPLQISSAIGNNERYIVEGSPGKGVWAYVPWVAVMDRFITESVQDGYYIVYLVKEDYSGIYLSLNQGVTTIRNQYSSAAKQALSIRSKDYLAKITPTNPRYVLGKIDLAASGKSPLGALYEVGAICSFYYPSIDIPGDVELINDLNELLEVYLLITSKESKLFQSSEAEDDELGLNDEDFRKIREHKTIERNRHLANNVKKVKGYTCETCGFNFEDAYGHIGKEYIEAHHLTPIHLLKGQKLSLDPRRDFAVLCSNCHRMIHKSEFVSHVAEFKAKYIVKHQDHMP